MVREEPALIKPTAQRSVMNSAKATKNASFSVGEDYRILEGKENVVLRSKNQIILQMYLELSLVLDHVVVALFISHRNVKLLKF